MLQIFVGSCNRTQRKEKKFKTVHEDSNKGTPKKTTKNSLHADWRRKMRKINIMCMEDESTCRREVSSGAKRFFLFIRSPHVPMAKTAFTVLAHAYEPKQREMA